MGKAARVGAAVLKSRAWKMAQVKAFMFNFFQLVISLFPPHLSWGNSQSF